MTFMRRSHSSSADGQSESTEEQARELVEEANASPVAYPGTSLRSFGHACRFAVRQIGIEQFVVTHERDRDGAFFVDSVYTGGHTSLESAKKEVDCSTRDWLDAANEDREAALEAQREDQADEQY